MPDTANVWALSDLATPWCVDETLATEAGERVTALAAKAAESIRIRSTR